MTLRTLFPVLAATIVSAGTAAGPAAAQTDGGCDVAPCAAGTLVTPVLQTPAWSEAVPVRYPHPVAASAAGDLRVQALERDRRWEGAVLGFAVGAAATWYVLYQGGSTGPCNRQQNQDAWSTGQCAAAAAAGGLVLAPVGFYIGSRIRVGSRRM